jgi:hypothetical protein
MTEKWWDTVSRTERWPWVVSPTEEREEVWSHVSYTDPHVGERWHPPGTASPDESAEAVAARVSERIAERERFFRDHGPVPPELLSQPASPLSRAERPLPLGPRIRARREALGKTYEDMDWVLGPDASKGEYWAYGDVWEEENVTFCARLELFRRVYAFLRFEPFQLLNLKCAFHEGRLEYKEYYAARRDELIRMSLEESGSTPSELAEQSGFCVASLQRIETDSDELETWTLDEIDDLAEALRLPVQLLLRLRCPKCGR